MFLALVPLASIALIAAAAFVARLAPLPQPYFAALTAVLFAIALVAGLQTIRHKDPN